MNQKPRPAQRNRPPQPTSTQSSKAPVIYIVIVSAVVFSMLIAGLAAIDFGALWQDDPDPTPDYNTNQIAIQQTAVAQNPDDMQAKALLASMLATSGRMPEAIALYEEVLSLEPDNTAIRLNFARSLQANDMSADAEAQFLRVLEIDPANHTAHYYLARLYLDWQPRRQDEAVEHLQRTIELAPNSFLAEQAQSVLDSLGPATPMEYQVTPIASIPAPQ